tara:strand:- start:26 stop:175 length:150 start_codon:yes stop_codon:yes gene_type:complete
MKTELKKLIAEKMILAAETETSDLHEIQKSLSCAYNIVKKKRLENEKEV